MRFATLFSAAALAFSAIAEPVPRMALQHSVRDAAAVQAAVADVTTCIKSLTKSVAQFSGDSIQIEADASALVTSIELGVKSIVESGPIDAAGLAGLQASITTLTTAGQELVVKLTAKKSQFEQAGLCGTVEKFMIQISNKSKGMIKTVCGLIPQQFQGAVEQIGNTVTAILVKGVTAYSESNCVSNPLANTSKSLVPYPTGSLTFSAIPISELPLPTTKTVQVTVTTCTDAVTQTSLSIVSPVSPVTPSYLPGTQTLVIPPIPTGASSIPLITAPQPAPTTTPVAVVPTSSRPATPTTAVPIAAGPRNSVGSAGLVAVAAGIAAAMLF